MNVEDSKLQNDFNQVKSKLLTNLNALLSKDKEVFSIGRADNFNTYVSDVITKIKDDFNEPQDQSFLESINEEVGIINAKLDKIITNEREKTVKESGIALLTDYVKKLNYELLDYSELQLKFSKLTFSAISASLNEVKDELTKFKRLRNIADNARTENIYNNAVDRYRILEADYRQYFYWGVSILVTLSFMLLITKPYLPFEPIEFWILKGSTLLVGITLLSYFLKQSTHYQKLADQNYQIQVELQAYPSFMDSVPTAEAAVIRKELALKYFGKEIDGSPHKEMSNLMSDQMKNSTELVKAATNILKKQ
ncbi:hypothetical protein [Acinetobacter rudis]|uniref:Uncharacterized protein n=1 Tax=Acinetobacter rudis CIP 110305 TaxID=421052 RepID=S3N0Y3_9GAMM|nr:hypothetical protein [Acinetobacter rudis]EPF73780.1 hypothetical protein F945_01939 [Acinetobacter rudis CIP 110305]